MANTSFFIGFAHIDRPWPIEPDHLREVYKGVWPEAEATG
jgi:hypothetical protein